MKNLAELRTNRWYCYADGIANRRHDYGYNEMLGRIVELMELAYTIGKKDGEKAAVDIIKSFSK